ncbi:MAG TPA: hypothetical protein VL598_12595 [Trinickia sp.]|jgi:hypothetical protein|uniref:hypothetical protein n=1 Tax=Trinickia sp. TaxID=2571163 RepID=UPI002C9680EA|nr:hypothetical protein [Trinickia sp.]HTI18496.1 hypothetical protein [Trinickia sp.]
MFTASPGYWDERRADESQASNPALREIELSVAEMLERLKPGRAGVARMHQKIRSSLAQVAFGTGDASRHSNAPASAASNAIDKALDKANAAYARQLVNLGLNSAAVELLRSWVELTVDARVLQRQLEIERALAKLAEEATAPSAVYAPGDDPSQLLPAAQMGRALGGVSDETVRQRENAGELFAILPPARKRGRGYPVFQAWPGIVGAPLAKVLSALGGLRGTSAYGFFTSPTDLLGGLTPIEAMAGRLIAPRSLPRESQNLLKASEEDRLAVVVSAAKAYAAAQAA